jgi:hypothetical protein
MTWCQAVSVLAVALGLAAAGGVLGWAGLVGLVWLMGTGDD